ncbi:MAG TPA: hypothetical protein VGC04_10870 [Cellulomonas sp.]
MPDETTHRQHEQRARERADLLARRGRARRRLPLDVALRIAMAPDPHTTRGRTAR